MLDRVLGVAAYGLAAWHLASWVDGMWNQSTGTPSDWNIWIVAARFMGYIN